MPQPGSSARIFLDRLSTDRAFRQTMDRCRAVALDRCFRIDIDRTYPDVFRDVLGRLGWPAQLSDADVLTASRAIPIARVLHDHATAEPMHPLEEIGDVAKSDYGLRKSELYQKMGLLFNSMKCLGLNTTSNAICDESTLTLKSRAMARLGLMLAEPVASMSCRHGLSPQRILRHALRMLRGSLPGLRRDATRNEYEGADQCQLKRVEIALACDCHSAPDGALLFPTAADKKGKLPPAEYLDTLPPNLKRVPTPLHALEKMAQRSPALSQMIAESGGKPPDRERTPQDLLDDIATGFDRTTRRMVRAQVAAKELMRKQVRAGIHPPNELQWGYPIEISFGLSIFVHTGVEITMAVAESTPELLLPGGPRIHPVLGFDEAVSCAVELVRLYRDSKLPKLPVGTVIHHDIRTMNNITAIEFSALRFAVCHELAHFLLGHTNDDRQAQMDADQLGLALHLNFILSRESDEEIMYALTGVEMLFLCIDILLEGRTPPDPSANERRDILFSAFSIPPAYFDLARAVLPTARHIFRQAVEEARLKTAVK